MEPESPARGVTTIGEFDNCVGLRTICECTTEDHSVDTWIEVGRLYDDMEDIIVTFHVNSYSHPLAEGFWQRVKNAGLMLIGVDQRQQEILLTKQQALNWCSAVQKEIKRMEK